MGGNTGGTSRAAVDLTITTPCSKAQDELVPAATMARSRMNDGAFMVVIESMVLLVCLGGILRFMILDDKML